MGKAPTSHLVKDQLNASVADAVNSARQLNEQVQQSLQDKAFERAVGEIDKVRDFIGSPENILGSQLTKHGEIAEQVEVGVSNAKTALAQAEMPATFDGIGRTAPADYMVDGVEVQSKFINGATNNLNHVLDHMDKYQDFGRDGSFYHIPKDHHETIMRVINGDSVEDLSPKTCKAILEKVEEIERESGKAFTDIVRPGVSDYGDVQQGKVHETLDNHENDIKTENTDRKEQIQQEHQASLAEGLKVTGIAAAIGGATSLGLGLYQKYKSGKNPFKGDFTQEDWKDLGLTTAKGAAGGAFAGASIYALTNYADMSAPFAGAIVSAVKGVASLSLSLHNGEIDFDEFVSLGLIVCSESAIVGVATAVGSTLIPIPILGSVIGSIAGKMLAEFATGKTEAVAEQVRAHMREFTQKLDERTKQVIAFIDAEFEKLGKLTDAAFDMVLNERLLGLSVELARAHGVEEYKIIKDSEALDDFMLS